MSFKTLKKKIMLRRTFLLVMFLFTMYVAVLATPSDDLNSMLSLTKDITNKPPSWSSDNAACNWQGAYCVNDNVTEIQWYGFGLAGSANLTMLPQGLTDLGLSTNNLTGVPDLASLPQGLETLYLSLNSFSGTPNLKALPEGLKYLWLDWNQFLGSGNFAAGARWCIRSGNFQYDMCGSHAGAFNCSSGVWSCTP